MKSRLVEALDTSGWTFDKTSLLLAEFKIGPLADYGNGPSLVDVIGGISDPKLIELYTLVMNNDVEEDASAIEFRPAATGSRTILVHSSHTQEITRSLQERSRTNWL
jgi:hypothetical protein